MRAHERQIGLEKISIIVVADETFAREKLSSDSFGVISKILRMVVRANNVGFGHIERVCNCATTILDECAINVGSDMETVN